MRGPWPTTDPLEILTGLRRGLDEHCDERVAIEFAAAAALPRVQLDGEVLHHLLLTAIFLGLEAGGPAGAVRVAARQAEEGVAFIVDDDGEPEDDEDLQALRARPLLLAVARALLAPRGGRVDLARSDAGARVIFSFSA